MSNEPDRHHMIHPDYPGQVVTVLHVPEETPRMNTLDRFIPLHDLPGDTMNAEEAAEYRILLRRLEAVDDLEAACRACAAAFTTEERKAAANLAVYAVFKIGNPPAPADGISP